MKSMLIPCVAAALVCSAGPVMAQAVYKCGVHSYSQQPCSKRVVRTYDAPVPVSPKPKVVAVRRLPGESAEDYAIRKRRAGLTDTDRDECARLDKRMPVERARLKGPDEADIDDAQSTLIDSQKRFKQLRC